MEVRQSEQHHSNQTTTLYNHTVGKSIPQAVYAVQHVYILTHTYSCTMRAHKHILTFIDIDTQIGWRRELR